MISQREEFENWWRTESKWFDPRESDGGIWLSEGNLAWAAWQAASQQPVMSEEEAVKVMVKALDNYKLHQGRFCHKAAQIVYHALTAKANGE